MDAFTCDGIASFFSLPTSDPAADLMSECVMALVMCHLPRNRIEFKWGSKISGAVLKSRIINELVMPEVLLIGYNCFPTILRPLLLRLLHYLSHCNPSSVLPVLQLQG